VLDFGDVLLTGLAADGGLYVPERWPALPPPGALAAAAEAGYPALAVEVMWPYVEGAIERGVFAALVADAYSTFDHPDVVPLVPLEDDRHLLELFWGPTLAFKDVALQLVGRLFDHELARRGERVTIVGATSGDTGSAAIEACRDRDNVDIVILHPAGRVSEVQRRQMTTVAAPNVHNVAVDGTFDDCQDLVKAMFADVTFRQDLRLSAVNSINWARVMAQIVYYVWASARLGRLSAPVAFSVPTGNFGNVFAGWVAARTGLPVAQFVVGSNRNDILTRFFTSGEMAIRDVEASLSPSMDIQVSSNLERLLFEALGRDGMAVAELLIRFREERHVRVADEVHAALSESWAAARVDDAATLAIIAEVHAATAMTIDPHTAVAVGAARAAGRHDVPMVVLATAHPAKFPDAVEQAIGRRPALPAHLADLFDRPEAFTSLPNDLGAVQAFVRAHSRA
jgi:threonine synthase